MNESLESELIALKKSLLEALDACRDQTEELRKSLTEMPNPGSPHDYAELVCVRIEETHALKRYLHLQNEFFELLKGAAPVAPDGTHSEN